MWKWSTAAEPPVDSSIVREATRHQPANRETSESGAACPDGSLSSKSTGSSELEENCSAGVDSAIGSPLHSTMTPSRRVENPQCCRYGRMRASPNGLESQSASTAASTRRASLSWRILKTSLSGAAGTAVGIADVDILLVLLLPHLIPAPSRCLGPPRLRAVLARQPCSSIVSASSPALRVLLGSASHKQHKQQTANCVKSIPV